MPDNSNKMTSGFWYGMMHIQNRENPQELGMSLDRAGAATRRWDATPSKLTPAWFDALLGETATLEVGGAWQGAVLGAGKPKS